MIGGSKFVPTKSKLCTHRGKAVPAECVSEVPEENFSVEQSKNFNGAHRLWHSPAEDAMKICLI
ncbi:hypothetical protein K443DRAFT_5399 [Laccaria amethystina LaAM-08-1]|uniref:Uncharacterized protein n=1 Tax=Laccaria amethystina LaAM-08-1 TaxID=1095629 RepID=A0A0C9XPI7_9AGAR|nr:hypothetical protein K443DRAFT_5399 [Laccaria amethystina LaAM-08-1]